MTSREVIAKAFDGFRDDDLVGAEVAPILLRLLSEAGFVINRKDAFERAAKIAEAYIDSDWPSDDQSNQARSIANDIRALSTLEEE
jgi:hypothetical protein